jgi:hypothetical protein
MDGVVPSKLEIRAARSVNVSVVLRRIGVRRGNHARIGQDTRYWKGFLDGNREQEVRNESRRVDTTQYNVSQSTSLPSKPTNINTE